MKLDVISPEKTIYSGQTEIVTLPGIQGVFTVLDRHAPIISPLNKGNIIYRREGKDISVKIEGGFVEVKNNVITVCVEQ
jgi:F-type H+-transporting ATPase subunit epsilon